MKLRNYLVDLLSNIIHDKLKMLSETKNEIKKIDDYKKVEELFSDINNVVNVDNESLKNILLNITDSDTVDGIISNIDMIKIVLNGKNSGLDLSLDESQEDLVKGVYEIVNNYREELENKNLETKEYLESFISKCKSLSSEIGTGVVRDIDTLDEIFTDNDVSIDDVLKCKFEILRNNSKNYNLNLEGNVKEEIELRILLKKIDIDFDSYSDIERTILVEYTNKENNDSIVNYLLDNNITLNSNQLFLILLWSNVDILSGIYNISNQYDVNISDLFKIPGVFISKDKDISSVLNNFSDSDQFYVIENMKYINPCNELFNDNISMLEANNRSVSDCFKYNMLSLITPDLSKNITILSDMDISNKVFSILVINPFLATSRSGFTECGLSDYIKNNPLRLTTSYYRLKSISSNIILARKNSKPIFRSLNDKKTYWLNKNITRNSEVI